MYYTQMKKAAFICNADLSFCRKHNLPILTGSFLVVSGCKFEYNLDSEKKGRVQKKTELSESLLLPKGRKKKKYIYIYIYTYIHTYIYVFIPIICKSK